MGLAGPKNRTKLDADPNNTHWSRDSSRFGQKVLRGLGWQPGTALGRRDAAGSQYAAAHHTPASLSHIRAVLKGDQLGLGAAPGKADGEFGLDIFARVLGRLNGKSEDELAAEEGRAKSKQAAKYVLRKLGSMDFVSGGFLIGDEIKKVPRKEALGEHAAGVEGEVEGRKKRKRRDGDEDSGEATSKPKKRKTKEEKLAIRSAKKLEQTSGQNSAPATKEEKPAIESSEQSESTDAVDASTQEESKTKAERRALKAARKEEKSEKKRRKKAADDTSPTPSSKTEQATSLMVKSTPAIQMLSSPSVASPATSITAAPRGRHVVRSRYIQQKKLATLDAKALNEIFMIKTPVK